LYAVVANDFATIDEKALDAELAKPPFSNNAYARAVVSESVGVLRRRKATYDQAIAKMASDAGYAAILRDATKTAYADFAKLREEWKAEAAVLDTLAKNISRGEEHKSAGCSKDLRHVMPKLLASYKTKNYQELRDRLADDPARGYLLHGVALCFAIDKVPGAGALHALAGKGRSFRGPRRLAYFAVLDALQSVRAKRPNLPLDTTNFWNYNGSTYGGSIEMTGGLPADKTESTGVVGKVTKSGSSVRVDFKKVVYSSPELFCKDTKKIVQITSDGGVLYERECQKTGKMSKIDETPPSVTVPVEQATKLAPGMFAVIDTDGTVLFVKKKSDAETVEAFLGYAL
jgi:hypothetical protein